MYGLVYQTEVSANSTFYIALFAVAGTFLLLVWYSRYHYKHRKTVFMEGKLIRKVVDERDEERNVQNIAMTRMFGPLHSWRQEGETRRYYVTFDTEKGEKSYTVSYDVYKRLRLKQKGIIKAKGSQFISFKRKG